MIFLQTNVIKELHVPYESCFFPIWGDKIKDRFYDVIEIVGRSHIYLYIYIFFFFLYLENEQNWQLRWAL